MLCLRFGGLYNDIAHPRDLFWRQMARIFAAIKHLPARLLIGVVRLYQLLLSPWLGRNCRFYPSCSAYMIEAVEKYGFWRGGWRGVRRIARCHPLHRGGYDPP